MAQEQRRSEINRGHRHDESPIILSSRVDGRGGHSVLRLNRHGVLIADVPFAIAYVPFAIALLIPSHSGMRATVMAFMAGHFLWPILISGWGLVRLEFNPFVIIVGAITTILVVSYGFARLGIAIGAAVLLVLPFFPANPLLVTGSLFPGAGLTALPVILLWVKLIELQRRFVTRCVFLLTLVAASPIITLCFGGTQPTQPSSVVYDEVDISDARGLTERGYWTQIMNRTGAAMCWSSGKT